jgi:hypothetical protein
MLDDVLSDSMFTGYMHGYNLPNMDKKELSKNIYCSNLCRRWNPKNYNKKTKPFN